VQDSGGGLGKVRTCDNREGEGREGPLSGTFLALTKKRAKKCTPVGQFLQWQGQEFRKDVQCRGVGGSMGDLPNVTGRSMEQQGPETLSCSACTREKRRHVTSAEDVLEGVGVEGEGMGGAGG
jgi:hypothetical protein